MIKVHFFHKLEDRSAASILHLTKGGLNKYGQEIIKLRFDTVYDFQEGLAPVVIDDKWGFIDQEGNILR